MIKKLDVKFQEVISNLPEFLQKILNSAPKEVKNNATEIKLRAGRQIRICFLNSFFCFENKLSAESIHECFKAICGYSVHSHIQEISQGFLTLKGGHRAGISATAIHENGSISNLKEISSINLRIARNAQNVCNPILNHVNDGGILIIGPPASGKTTILKNLAKKLSEFNSVSIIDSRGEIAACLNSIPQNDVGFSDVFSFWNRKNGIEAAIKTMNPKFIICDEIGNETDLAAAENCACSGVNLIATAHGSSLNSLNQRKIIKQLIKTSAFKTIVLLEGKTNPCKIKSILKVGDSFENNWRFINCNLPTNSRNHVSC